jgi:hypothetical protein
MAVNVKQGVFERNINALFRFVTQQDNFSAEKLIEFLQTEKAENFVDLSRFSLLAKFYEQDKSNTALLKFLMDNCNSLLFNDKLLQNVACSNAAGF